MVRIPDTGNEGSIPSGNVYLGKFTSNGNFSNLPVAGFKTASYEVAYSKNQTATIDKIGISDLGERNSIRYIDTLGLIMPTKEAFLDPIEVPNEYSLSQQDTLYSTGTFLIHRYIYKVDELATVKVNNQGSFGFSGGNATLPKVYVGPTRANSYNINTKLATSTYTIVKPGHYLLIFLHYLTRESDAWSSASQFGPYKWHVRFIYGTQCLIKVEKTSGGTSSISGTFERQNSWDLNSTDLNNLNFEKYSYCFTRQERTGQDGGTEICIVNGHFDVGDKITMEMCDNCFTSSDTLTPSSDSLVLTNCSRAMGMVYIGPSMYSNLALMPVSKTPMVEDQMYNFLNTGTETAEFEAPVDGNYLFLLTGRGNGINMSPTSIFPVGMEKDSNGVYPYVGPNIHDINAAQQVIATSNWSTGLRFWRCTLSRGQQIQFVIPAATSAETTLREIIPTVMLSYK